MLTGQSGAMLVGISAIFLVSSFARQRPVMWSWLVMCGLFAIGAAYGYWARPAIGGWLALAFGVLVMAPLWLLMFARRAHDAHRPRLARVLARASYTLHPGAAARSWLRVLRGARLLAEGKHAEAHAELGVAPAAIAAGTRLADAVMRGDWHAIVAALDAASDPLDAPFAVVYVRALGELGLIDRMCALQAQVETDWASERERERLFTARLFFAAFLGRVDVVEAVLAAPPLRGLPQTARELWRATARMAAGELDGTAPIWAELATSPEPRTRMSAAQRQAHPLARAPAPDAATRALLDAILVDARDLATYAAPPRTRPIAVWAIAAVTVAAHVVSLAWPAAIAYGIYWTPYVIDGHEWWRLATPMLLHAGWGHLAMNMIALLVLGPFVEQFLGRARFVIIYLAGGIGCFALICAIDALGWHAPTAALGASGSVMALIGASAAIYARGMLARSPLATQRLRGVLALVGTQVVFDILVPHISMTGHLGGLAVGFVLAFALAPRTPRHTAD